MDGPLELHLPWPPSVNKYWRRVGAKTIISKEGREYKDRVRFLVRQQNGKLGLDDRLKVEIKAFPPDHRRRDLDNILKAILDAITDAGTWKDDCLIDHLTVWRLCTSPPGRVEVLIERIL